VTPEEIAAAIRDPDSGAMPVQVGVFCDDCGTTVERDYLVAEDSTQKQRFQVARHHLRQNEGWQCDEHGDFCPACVSSSRVGEDDQEGDA
jgi:hypothetical protein